MCRNLAENVLPKQPPRFCVIISMASREIGLFRRLKTTEGVVLHSFLYKHNRGKECSLNLLCVQMTRTSWTNVSTAEPSTTHLPWPLSSWHYRAWMTSACVCVSVYVCIKVCLLFLCCAREDPRASAKNRNRKLLGEWADAASPRSCESQMNGLDMWGHRFLVCHTAGC